MAEEVPIPLPPKETVILNNPYLYGYAPLSSTEYLIKWLLFGLIFFLFFSWFVGGSLHARLRLKKGLAPLRYHRWLVTRSTRPNRTQYNHAPPYYPANHTSEAFYNSQGVNDPPPFYSRDFPPSYQPPRQAGVKVDVTEQTYRPADTVHSTTNSNIEMPARLHH